MPRVAPKAAAACCAQAIRSTRAAKTDERSHIVSYARRSIAKYTSCDATVSFSDAVEFSYGVASIVTQSFHINHPTLPLGTGPMQAPGAAPGAASRSSSTPFNLWLMQIALRSLTERVLDDIDTDKHVLFLPNDLETRQGRGSLLSGPRSFLRPMRCTHAARPCQALAKPLRLYDNSWYLAQIHQIYPKPYSVRTLLLRSRLLRLLGRRLRLLRRCRRHRRTTSFRIPLPLRLF